MKMPLWTKGKDGKWHRFPYEHLAQLADGRYALPNGGSLLIFHNLCEETGWGMNHWFVYSIAMDAFILKEET